MTNRQQWEPGLSILEVAALEAFYGRAQVLFGLGFTVAPGEVLALVGRNGAGKSTTLKAVMRVVRRTEGRLTYGGQDLTRLTPDRAARLGIGWVPEDRRVYAELTVDENLTVGERAGPGPAWTRARVRELFPKLGQLAGRLAGHLSGGEQQMLTIARTLMGRPSLLLLDEPAEGLAPLIVAELATAVRTLKSEGLAIILSEQNLRFAAAIADRACVLESGEQRWLGPMPDLMAAEDLRRQWLAV